ncbi:MAG: WhiB family transcriptional regulator [Actinomycetota bacterium]
MSIVTTRDPAAPKGAPGAVRPVPPVGYDHASWQESAACRDADTELFFPIGSVGAGAVQTRQAQQICARCPVRPECLMYALASSQEYGIWGGYDENERRPLHRAWRHGGCVPRQPGPDGGPIAKENRSWSR